jgi:SAC3 family protein LENG8/THP3
MHVLHPQADTLVAARQRGGSAFGTSTALEKQYLRLTAAPAADTVRPPHVLERALSVLKAKWQQVRCRGEMQ